MLDQGEIEAPPSIGSKLNTDFIQGIGKQNGNFVIILNINQVFSPEELGEMAASVEPPVAEQESVTPA